MVFYVALSNIRKRYRTLKSEPLVPTHLILQNCVFANESHIVIPFPHAYLSITFDFVCLVTNRNLAKAQNTKSALTIIIFV